MESVLKTMGSVGAASKNPPLIRTSYENPHNGWSQQLVGFFVGMAFSSVPGAGELDLRAAFQSAFRSHHELVGLNYFFKPRSAASVRG